jgi:hypothetical protein
LPFGTTEVAFNPAFTFLGERQPENQIADFSISPIDRSGFTNPGRFNYNAVSGVQKSEQKNSKEILFRIVMAHVTRPLPYLYLQCSIKKKS